MASRRHAGYTKPPRFSMGVTIAPWDQEGLTEYRGFQIQKHFVRKLSTGFNKYEYRIVGYPTTYSDWAYACEDIDHIIRQRHKQQESC